MEIEKKVIIKWPDLKKILTKTMEENGFDVVQIDLIANRPTVVSNFQFEKIEVKVTDKKIDE